MHHRHESIHWAMAWNNTNLRMFLFSNCYRNGVNMSQNQNKLTLSILHLPRLFDKKPININLKLNGAFFFQMIFEVDKTRKNTHIKIFRPSLNTSANGKCVCIWIPLGSTQSDDLSTIICRKFYEMRWNRIDRQLYNIPHIPICYIHSVFGLRWMSRKKICMDFELQLVSCTQTHANPRTNASQKTHRFELALETPAIEHDFSLIAHNSFQVRVFNIRNWAVRPTGEING